MSTLPVYLDYAASTPVDSRVADVMHTCLIDAGLCGNPAAGDHAFGRMASERIEGARSLVAQVIGAAQPDEVIWTSGATESDNLAIIGAARYRAGSGRHIVTSVAEHPAVLSACRYLEKQGFKVTYLSPDALGVIKVAQVEEALTPETTLVSLMHVNNETGVIQDIAGIGAMCRGRNVLFHVDAAQSVGHLALDVAAQCIDLLSLSAQKVYGPKGVGALYLNRQTIPRIEPLMFGGDQERGLRPGTVATHQVVGMGEAFRIAAESMTDDVSRIGLLQARLWDGIRSLPGVLLNGHPDQRACHILNVSVTGVEGESLHYALSEMAVSAGSACATERSAPSGVLRSLGRSDQLARASVRFSLGRPSTEADIDLAISCFRRAVKRLRDWAPVNETGVV